ncbi:MAG: hypothetical protein U9Q74_08985 [Gemmatimonadota bacterium]|nr:hypothetical protein [Gemmatimonadota bacterium]
MKPRWQMELEEGVKQLEAEVSKRKGVSQFDPVADGIAYAAGEFKTRLATLVAPGRELTPAEWAAEQDPPIAEQTVRNYIRQGRLEARRGPTGFLILANARVRERGTDAP